MFLNFEFDELGEEAKLKFNQLVADVCSKLPSIGTHRLTTECLTRHDTVKIEVGSDSLTLVLRKYEANPSANYVQIRYTGARGSVYANSPTGINLLDTLLPELTLSEPWVYHKDVGDPDNIPWNMSLSEYFRSDLIDSHFLLKYLIEEINANGKIVTPESVTAWQRLPDDIRQVVNRVLLAHAAIKTAIGELKGNFELTDYGTGTVETLESLYV